MKPAIISIVLLAIVLSTTGCQNTSPKVKQITVTVFQLPTESQMDLSKPLPKVANARIEVAGTPLNAHTNVNGQVVITVPTGVQTFTITAPNNALLKKASYTETVLELGTDTFGFGLSETRELNAPAPGTY